jgi:hypothetical protein
MRLGSVEEKFAAMRVATGRAHANLSPLHATRPISSPKRKTPDFTLA